MVFVVGEVVGYGEFFFGVLAGVGVEGLVGVSMGLEYAALGGYIINLK